MDGEFSKSLKALDKIIVEGTKYSFFPEYAYAFNLLGIINMLQNNPLESKVFYKQALSLANKHRMKSLKAKIYSNLSVADAALGHHDLCIEDLMLAIQLGHETDQENLDSYYYNLARNYIEVGKSKEAQEALDNCINYNQNSFPESYFVFLKKGIAELNHEEALVKKYLHEIYDYYETHTIFGQDIDLFTNELLSKLAMDQQDVLKANEYLKNSP